MVPPPAAEFKFDVDGSTKGKPGLVSFVTWKVSWWEYSLVLLIFKTQIIQDSWPFFCLAFFSTSPFVRTPLISESNSKIALTWIEKTEQRPWNKWYIFNDIATLKLSIIVTFNILSEAWSQQINLFFCLVVTLYAGYELPFCRLHVASLSGCF